MNKISVSSSVTIQKSAIKTLCFVDGLFVPKSKYTLENHELTLHKEAKEHISLFYSTQGETYNFEAYLNEQGVVVGGTDLSGNYMSGIVQNRLMVFVDGVLLQKEEFQVLDSNNIAIMISKPNEKHMSSVCIFLAPEGLKSNRIVGNPGSPINLGYNINNMIIFKNGVKINHKNITTINGGFIINEGYDITVDTIEYYMFPDGTSNSINFTGELGYLNYGPKDDNKQEIPLYYDAIFTFSDVTNIIIDNARRGMYIKADNGIGTAIIVDDNFETNSIKAIIIEDFYKNSLSGSEYHLEVPSYKSITDYLSTYDKSKQLLPEVLTVFQRVLVDEFRDSIDRLQNIRSLSKVDSKNINRLIKLLGFNLDIKRLTIKQRKELLSELNEFYRIAGTQDAYNFFNILQDSTRIISINQLFTPLDNGSKEGRLSYVYKYLLENPGDGYRIGERYQIKGSNLSIVVNSLATIDEEGTDQTRGPIGSFTYSVFEGTETYNNTGTAANNLIPMAEGATLSINSVADYWDYNFTVTSDNVSFVEGTELSSPNYQGKIIANEITDGKITGFSATIDSGNRFLDIQNEPLYTSMGATKLHVASRSDSKENFVKTFETKTETGALATGVTLEPGVYRIELIGGGGGGGQSINGRAGGFGATSIPTIEDVIIKVPTKISYQVGAGGRKPGGGANWNGGAGGSCGNNHNGIVTGGKGGGGGFATFIIFDREVTKLSDTKTPIQSLISQGGGGGGGAGGSGWSGRWGGGGSGGGGGGYYHTEIVGTTVTTTNYAGKKGGAWGGQDDGSGSNGAAGNTTMFPELFSGSGGRGGYYGERWRGYGGSGAYGGGASGGGGAAGAGNHSSAYGGGAGGGAGGSKGASGGQGGIGKQNGTDGNNFGSNNGDPSTQTDHYSSELVTYGVGGKANEQGNSGFLRIKKIKQFYSGQLNWEENDTPALSIEDTISTPKEEFSAKITNITKEYADVELTPASGWEYIDQEYYSVKEASLSVTSTPVHYKYLHYMSGVPKYYAPTMVLHEGESEGEYQYSVTIDSVDKNGTITASTLSPSGGVEKIELTNLPTWVEHGSGGTIQVESRVNSQKNNERTYVDFYRKDEYPVTPAEKQTEYRINVEDYGSVTEGTPNSPYPWSPQIADMDYAYSLITDDPDADYSNDYGSVAESIKGVWYEWWTWDRPRNAYATNHVEVEINILAGENFDEIIDRFYRQFYSIASTVLYIHRLVTVFNFGDSQQTPVDQNSNASQGIISLGLLSAPTARYEKYFVTSDPKTGKVIK